MTFKKKVKEKPATKKVDNKTDKRLSPSNKERLAAQGFQKGQVANPLGRPKGSRSKFAETFLKDFLADWEVAGASAIQMCRLEDPAAYCRIAASLLPKELNIKEGDSGLDQFLEQLNDEQLDQFINGLMVLGSQKGAITQTTPLPSKKPNTV